MGRLNISKKPNKTLVALGLLFLVSFFLVAATGIVFSKGDHERAKILKEMGDIRPLDEILARVKQDYPGTIIEVELEEEEGLIIYELEILDERGVVLELKYDAKSGAFLTAEEED